MRLLVNGSERVITGPEDRPLSSVLAEVQECCLAGGETITGISIDGQAVAGGALAGDPPIRYVGTVSVEVKSFYDLTVESLAEAESYLPRLADAVARAASCLQRGREGEGIELIQAAMEGFDWLQQLLGAVGRLKAAGQGEWLTVSEAGLLFEREAELCDLFDGCGEALAAGDFVLLADRLEYDLVPWLEQLQAELGGLRQRLEGGR